MTNMVVGEGEKCRQAFISPDLIVRNWAKINDCGSSE